MEQITTVAALRAYRYYSNYTKRGGLCFFFLIHNGYLTLGYVLGTYIPLPTQSNGLNLLTSHVISL